MNQRLHNPDKIQPSVPRDLYGRPQCEKQSEKKHDLASYVWLVYSAFFFIQPVMARSATYWKHQLPVYGLFLALYASYVQFTRTLPRLLLIAGIFLLGVVSIPTNVGGSCFFIYVAALLPFCVESSAALIGAMLLELVTLAIESRLFPNNLPNYIITGLFVVVVGVSNLFVAQGKRADQKLRSAQAENVELAAVAERERIARDLHDVLGHTLSVIVLKAELAGRLMGKDDVRAAAEIADVERTARAALAEVREAIGGYRAKGLNAEIEQARQTLEAAGVKLICTSPAPSLRAREETVLALAVREAVTNIVRHAQATECTLRFATAPDGFSALEVADNGRAGSGNAGSGASGFLNHGAGLRGMRERVEELGGRFRIERAVESTGTRLLIELPRTGLIPAGGR